MILPRLSIERPVLASMMSLLLILFGLISLSRLPVRELPDIDPPIVSVTTIYPGANASVIETEVTERLEEAVNNIEGIKSLRSESREQVSSIIIEFELARDLDLAAQDVRDRVSGVRQQLPEAIDEPVVSKQDADANAIMWIGINSDRYSTLELTFLAENRIKNRLQTVQGVSRIRIGGEKRFAIRLWLEAEKMAAHGVTVLDVQTALEEQNVELPSGRVENWEREMTIETRGQLKTPEEFNRLVIRNEGTRIVRLRDIGEAREGVEDERTIARQNGKPCVFLGVVKQSKANTIAVAEGIKAELARVRTEVPAGVSLNINYDESIYVQRAIHEVWITLGIAFSLVVLVVFAFLRSFRSTLVPAVAIPVSIIATFFVLYLFDYSINLLSMLALVLSIGIVVDDAIVVLENIYRHIERGETPRQAALKGMQEISFAVIATTVALVAVFVPLAFQQTSTGRLFIEFAVAVVGAVIVSTFVALSLSPMIASRLLRPVKPGGGSRFMQFTERGFDKLQRLYETVLDIALSHRVWVMLLGLGTAVLTVIAYQALEEEFLPDEDKGRFLAFVIAPEGATSEYTDRMVREAEEILAATPEIEVFGSITAFGFAGPGRANQAIIFAGLREERERNVREIVNGPDGLRNRFFNEVEGAIALPILPKAIGRSFEAPLQLVLQDDDLDALDSHAQKLGNRLRKEGFLLGVQSSFKFDKPELQLDIDRDRATALGVSIDQVSRTLQILFGGLDLSRIFKGGKEYDVIAQLQRTSRLIPRDLDRLYVRNKDNALVQLNNVIRVNSVSAPNIIEHYNRLRSATISGTPIGVPLGTAMTRVEAILHEELPDTVRYDWRGESRDLLETGIEALWFIVVALIIVYMALASQFESLVHPVTVILSVPLAAFGACGLLWVLNYGTQSGWLPDLPGMNSNLFSKIGLMLLIGLVTKNAILLVEFANQQRLRGLNARDAMRQAGAIRLRPILMTAISTMAGILPIAIGFGVGAESRRPMGVAVVGGMLTSTFLTLLIIPVVYTVFSDLGDWVRGRRSPAV